MTFTLAIDHSFSDLTGEQDCHPRLQMLNPDELARLIEFGEVLLRTNLKILVVGSASQGTFADCMDFEADCFHFCPIQQVSSIK